MVQSTESRNLKPSNEFASGLGASMQQLQAWHKYNDEDEGEDDDDDNTRTTTGSPA